MTGLVLHWTGLVSLAAGAAGWFAWWCSRPLRGTTEAAGTRVDWTWVRIMEYEIWGRTFRHEGAPGISGQDSAHDPRAAWCDCHGTIPGHFRAPRHYDPQYGHPAADAPVLNSPDPPPGMHPYTAALVKVATRMPLTGDDRDALAEYGWAPRS